MKLNEWLFFLVKLALEYVDVEKIVAPWQITHYEVEKMDVATNQWLPVKSVKGLSLQVGNLVEGKQYQFLVRACNDAGDSADLETEDVITAKNPFDPPSKNFYAIGYLTLQTPNVNL